MPQAHLVAIGANLIKYLKERLPITSSASMGLETILRLVLYMALK